MTKRSLQVLILLTITSILFSGVGAPTARAGGSACYVNASASGANDGTSWANAYVDLQSALGNLSCFVIWVAAGVYYPTSSSDRTISFHVNPGVSVYGGFAGTETSILQRLPGAHRTILSGDIDKNDITTLGVDVSYTGISGFNSYHVVTMDGTTTPVTAATVLDGVTVTGGEANGAGFPDLAGGGLYCAGNGGGSQCNPNLVRITFSGNAATDGGAMLLNGNAGGNSSPLIATATFSGNGTSGAGGALYNYGDTGSSSPVLNNATFANNTAGTSGGAIYNNGNAGSSSPQLINVTFSGNSAGSTGGALYDLGTSAGASNPTISDSIFWGDTASVSNEIFNDTGATPQIDHSDVEGSGGSGGSWNGAFGTDGGGNIDSNPKRYTLAYNGGWNETQGLLPSSPAIDAGSDASCIARDEREVVRPQGLHCDMGAFERTVFVRADFDGNHTTDLSVFRPSTGVWYVKNQFNTTWGQSGDVPVPADYNGDGKVEVAAWRPSTGIWYIKGVSNSAWGASGDVPVPGDYNGDGKIDVAVWRPSNGTWYVKGQFTTTWGQSGDIPVPGDYNGDGKTDLAVFRPSTGTWYIKGYGNFAWGAASDIPVPADYDGSGTTDVAVWRPSTGVWYVKGLFTATWGSSGDVPVPGDFNADERADIAVWRPSTGTWYVKSLFTTPWGSSGDFPVVAPDTNGNGTPYQ